jgi:S-adenosylmethionine hydrolase
MAPLVTLTTDFGMRDAYVAELKGVLCAEGPHDLRLLDLSHELPPFDVPAAAWFVRAALPRFPAGTVHVVIVDPGVGSARKPLLAQLGGQFLVGPDNGVFGLLFDGTEQVFEIDPLRLGPRSVSATFHGRDLFAPVAARLSGGTAPMRLGAPIQDYLRCSLPDVERTPHALTGAVIHVDHYGNLITNIAGAALRDFASQELATITCAGAVLEGVLDHYAQVSPGQLLCLVGSAGFLEISARESSAAQKLGAGVGSVVRLTKRS